MLAELLLFAMPFALVTPRGIAVENNGAMVELVQIDRAWTDAQAAYEGTVWGWVGGLATPPVRVVVMREFVQQGGCHKAVRWAAEPMSERMQDGVVLLIGPEHAQDQDVIAEGMRAVMRVYTRAASYDGRLEAGCAD